MLRNDCRSADQQLASSSQNMLFSDPVVSTSQHCILGNNAKRKFASDKDATNNCKKRRLEPGDVNASVERQIVANANHDYDVNEYQAGGLKHSVHGVAYQLKLLMLFLKRGVEAGYAFRLATEMVAAEKFDDIVFRYRNKRGRTVCRFLQAKHKQDESITIGTSDLLNESNDDFSIQKYFISYRQIKRHPELRKSKLKDFTIYANINFDVHNETWKSPKVHFRMIEEPDFTVEQLQINEVGLKRVEKPDTFLDLESSSKETARYQLLVHTKSQLHEMLKKTSNAWILAKTLAKHVFKDHKITLRGVFKSSHIALTMEQVIDNRNKCFSKNFINGENLSNRGKSFREIFCAELAKLMGLREGPTSDKAVWKMIDEKKLRLVPRFGDGLLTDPKLEIEFFVEFVQMIKSADKFLVKLDKRKSKVIARNIKQLAGHVLVKSKGKQIYKFQSQFFTNSIKHPGNIEDLKKLMIAKLKDKWKDLRRYRFKINNFPTYIKEQLHLENELPDNELIDNREISEFFEKLVFAVNQPNEIELESILMRELAANSQFNLKNSNLAYDSLLKKMMDWFKYKQGIFLTTDKGKAFFESIEGDINTLVCSGMSLSYLAKLEKYDIKFKDENQEVENFLISNLDKPRSFNLIVSEKILLSAIRVHQTIRKLKEYEKYDSLMFVRLRSLLPPEIENRVIRAVGSLQSHNLLVIQCGSTDQDELQKLCKKLRKVMKKNVSKKLILITKPPGIQTNSHLQHCVEKRDEISFNNLTKDSQQKLLDQTRINFQATTWLSFRKLLEQRNSCNIVINKSIDFGRIIDSSTLVKLIREKEIKVGNNLKELGEVADFYIKRTFNQQVFLKKDILKCQLTSEVFAITDFKKPPWRMATVPETFRSFGEINQQTRDSCKFINLDTKQEAQQFEELCNEYLDLNHNVHWLKYSVGKFIWKKSQGNITNLLKYRDHDNYHVEKITGNCLPEDQLADFNDSRKVVIISDTAGMGKTTVLTSLARKMKETKSAYWVINIDLNNFTEVLEEVQNSKDFYRNDDRAIDFFVEKLSNLETDLEKTILKSMIKNHGNVVLLVDGFDEISPHYKETVVVMLQIIKNLSGVKKLFVSTRPHIGDALERGLETFSHTIEPFSEPNQIEFLNRFWKTGLRLDCPGQQIEDRLTTYAEALIKKVADSIGDRFNKFLGIPLQTRMIAEIYQENVEENARDFDTCKEFLNSENVKPRLPIKMNIVDLYKHFVDNKYDIWYKEKSKADLSNTSMIGITDGNRRTSLEMHQIFALYTLFTVEDLETLLNKPERENLNAYVAEINEGKEKIGIIIGKAQFIHRSFAEYFTANFIINKLISGCYNLKARTFIVEQILLEPEYDVIRAFLNGLLSPRSSLCDRQSEDKASMNEPWRILLERRNKFRETIFHVAVKERNIEIIKFLLNQFGSKDDISQFLNEAKDCADETALYVAASGHHWDELRLLCEHGGASINCSNPSGRTPLHEAVSSGDLPTVKWLVENGADLDAKSMDNQTPLHWAALSGKLHILEYLIDKTGVDVDSLLHDIRMSNSPSTVRKWLAKKRRAVNRCAVSGSESASHGHIKQLKLCVLFLTRAVRNDYPGFRIVTGMDSSEKFYDLIVQYGSELGSGTVSRLLKVKYKTNKSKKIRASDLLNVTDGDFSLQKYFSCYRKIKRDLKPTEIALKDYIVWTNVDFDIENLQEYDIDLQKVEENDPLLNIRSSLKKSVRYKFAMDEQSQLYELLNNSSDSYALAKILAEHVFEKKPLTLHSGIFKYYHTALATEIIDVRTKGFFVNFIENKNLSEIAKKFRKIFIAVSLALMQRQGDCPSQEIMWAKTKEKMLHLSSSFGAFVEPRLVNLKQFYEEFAKLLKCADNNYLVKFDKKNNVIASNIEKLIGRVLVAAGKKKMYKFQSQFLDDSIAQSDNIDELKSLLKVQLGMKYSNLAQFRFKMQNVKLHPTNELPDDAVKSSEISDFLDKMIFVVNNPNEDQLGDIMRKDIIEYDNFHVPDANSISNFLEKEFLDLLKKKDKALTCLTAVDYRAVLDSIKQKADTLLYSLMSSCYPEELQNYGIEFEDENQELEGFLVRYLDSPTNKPALKLISAGDTLRTTIRVHQVIQRTQRYGKTDSLIFIHSRVLLEPEMQNQVIRTYESQHSHDLLVIECGSDYGEQLQILCNELYEIMAKNSVKKLILITTNSGMSNLQFENYQEKHNTVSFNNLTRASRQKLLERPCINLQGKKGMSFQKLLGQYICNEIVLNKSTAFGCVINSSMLVSLIRGEEMKVGDDLPELGFYVKHTFNEVFLKKGIFKCQLTSEVFAISGIDRNELLKVGIDPIKIQPSNVKEIDLQTKKLYKFIILDKHQDEQQFRKLCKIHSNDKRNVHWLKSESNKFILKKSHGNITNLLEYRDVDNCNVDETTTSYMTEDQLAHDDTERKVVIISADAGMGKTTAMTSLAIKIKEKYSDMWVISSNLNDFTQVVKNDLVTPSFDQNDVSRLVEFFVENFAKLQTDMEKWVLKTMIKNHDGVAVLLDGFDKVMPTHQNTVLDLLQAMKKSTGVKKLFVSTTPHMTRALETKLQIFSHTITTPNEIHKISFLNEFWKTRLGRSHEWLQVWQLWPQAKALIQQYANSIDDQINKFVSIPLQMRMIAEICLNETEKKVEGDKIQEELSRLQKKWNIVELYRRFVNKKCNAYCSSQAVKEGSEQLCEIFLKEHQGLSLSMFFSVEDLKILLNEQEVKKIKKCITKIKNGKRQTGIITHIIDRKPQFIHYSFAEYFTAIFLINNLKNGDHNRTVQICIVHQILLQPNHKVTRVFLNGLLLEMSSSSDRRTNDNAPTYNVSWKSILTDCRTLFGATVFHVAAEEGHDEIIKFFLDRFGNMNETGEFLNNAKDDDGQTALNVAVFHRHLKTQKLLVRYGGARMN